MLLESPTGESLELLIDVYQFPALRTEPYDSNWLYVTGKVAHRKAPWKFRHPCLLTYEAQALVTWLESVAHGRDVVPVLSFTEPLVEFRLHGPADARVVRIFFRLEARAPWIDPPGYEDPEWIDIPVDGSRLLSAAASLRVELAKFPQRAPV
jgi:hypothetical protein